MVLQTTVITQQIIKIRRCLHDFRQVENQAAMNKNRISLIFLKGDQIIAFAAGGSFLGGLIAQIPGAAIGALLGVVFGLFYKNHKSNRSEKNDDRYNLS